MSLSISIVLVILSLLWSIERYFMFYSFRIISQPVPWSLCSLLMGFSHANSASSLSVATYPRVVGGLEPIPVDIGWEAGYTSITGLTYKAIFIIPRGEKNPTYIDKYFYLHYSDGNPFGCDWIVSTMTVWISMKTSVDIHGTQRIDPSDIFVSQKSPDSVYISHLKQRKFYSQQFGPSQQVFTAAV